MPTTSPLSRLLARAREREFAQLALDKGALALSIVMGGMVLLLLAGTDILDWFWLALLAVVSIGVGAYRISKSRSSRYLLAQRIDQKMALADAISTALYFAENPQPEKAAICESQRREAEVMAAQVDVRNALPFARSRYLAPAAALTAAAFGLFAARYLVTGSLDLKASLVRVVYDNFFGSKTPEARTQLPKRAKFDPITGEPSPETPSIEADRQPEDLLDSQNQSDSETPGDDNSKTASQEGSQKKGDSKSADKGKEDPSGDSKDAAQDQNGQQSNSEKNASNKDGKEGGKPSSGNQKSESMLDKMKDALSSLMDKMKPQSSEGSKSDQASPKSNPTDQKQDQGDKAQPSKDQQSQAAANGDQSQQAEGKQSSDASNDKKASEKSSSQDSKNGIGSQDGEKAIKLAQELDAKMGKISQILGQRSAAVSGEMMVEVGSSKQQLKTPWAQTQATHSNAGGEIHRDEIPLAEQQFVERYFEEVHKSAPPPAAGSQDKGSQDKGSPGENGSPAKKSGNGN